MNLCEIHLIFSPEIDMETALKEAKKLSAKYKCIAMVNFNGVNIEIQNNSRIEDLLNFYNNHKFPGISEVNILENKIKN